MNPVDFWPRAARVLDAIALPGALLWALYQLPPSTSLTVWVCTGVLVVWLTRRVLRAVHWEAAYRFSMLSIAAAVLAALNFVWSANLLQRWLW